MPLEDLIVLDFFHQKRLLEILVAQCLLFLAVGVAVFHQIMRLYFVIVLQLAKQNLTNILAFGGSFESGYIFPVPFLIKRIPSIS